MNLAPTEPVFSLDFGHLRSPRFGADQLAATGQPLGLKHFIGDGANGMLRYFCQSTANTLRPEQLPIVFYGPPSTGKTSLAMALLSAALESVDDESAGGNPFVSATDLDRRYRQALETQSLSQFRQRLLSGVGLVIDNLHQLAGKTATQLEFIQILDEACRIGFPIIITLDQAPAKSESLIPQLQSRLTAGLTILVHPPGQPAREKILLELANHHQLHFTPDAVQALAQQLPVTVPKLTQTIIQLKSRLLSSGIDLQRPVSREQLIELFQSADQDIAEDSALIIARVAQRFHLRPRDLVGASRKQSIVLARGVAVYLHRQLLGASFQKIGNCFGNRDHSTVLHAYTKMKQLIESDQLDAAATRQTVLELEQRLSDMITGKIQLEGILKTC